MYEQTVKSGFDVTGVVEFREKTLRSHAHGEILAHILGDHAIPVVLMFLNAIHMPSLSPKRCFALGCAIADAVRLCRPADERVGVYASGGCRTSRPDTHGLPTMDRTFTARLTKTSIAAVWSSSPPGRVTS